MLLEKPVWWADMLVEGCSVLCIHVVFDSLQKVFKFVLLFLKYKELEGSISCWSGNFR